MEVTGTEATVTETTEATAVDTAVEAAADTSLDTTALGGEIAGAETTETAEAAVEGPPEKYEFTASEGLTLDAETLAEAEPVFRELGLTNEAAQKLMPLAEKFAERIASQTTDAANAQILSEVTAQRKTWLDEAKADATIGGENWGQSMELSAKALDGLGYPKGSAFRNFLTESGLGNHPEMVRAFRTIGERISEDGFVRGDAAAAIKPSREAILYPDDVRKEGAI